MVESGSLPLADWQSFYVIVGSSGAALIGLQFIVITLIAQSSINTSHQQIDAFGTPQIVHFGAALVVSTIMSIPWHALRAPSFLLGACGLFGFVFIGLSVRRALSQGDYTLVWQDWLWHTIAPFIVYGTLMAAAVALASHEDALFVTAAAALSLVFIGIRNAWDTVTFIVVERMPDSSPSKRP
jgi:hypothetical protein